MESRKSKITLYDIVAIGLMAAFVFIATFFFKIKIPTPGGSTMVKLGNGICLLCGTLLGGWRGGLAAGIGCMAVPILNEDGSCHSAIGVTGHIEEYRDPESFRFIHDCLTEAAEKLRQRPW